jgi:acetylornithine deacetylase/succinyl-diaminopimelate desuccinylase-like protein
MQEMSGLAVSDVFRYDQLAVELLTSLIRFDTTNPPGNEHDCIAFINDLLKEAGFETVVLSKAPRRPNLVTRLPGRGVAPPLLLYGHVDVVPAAGQQWTHPPFEAKIADECVWGRGAVDMKGGMAMMLTALLQVKAEGLVPAGDIVFAAVSDEEAGGDFGARFLVEEHPHLFEGIRYALGELGGFPMWVAGTKFYPIQIAEKQVCWMKATTRGPGGHGSMPLRGGAMAKMSHVLQRMDENRLPVHICEPTRQMIEAMAAGLSFPAGTLLRKLLVPQLTDWILRILGERGEIFQPLLRNTVNATVIKGGESVNVIPSEITVEIDGRLLPGFGPPDMLRELRAIIGSEVDLEVIRQDPGPAEPDLGLVPFLAEILTQADPGSVPVPFIVPGITDARFFSRLGIQTYGFTPMNLPPSFSFVGIVHAADERIPLKAVHFGTRAIYRVIERYGMDGNL